MINFNEIARYIVKEVQENAITNGKQFCVSKDKVFEKFNLERTEENEKAIIEALTEREEIADIEEDTECYDIVLYLFYSPNYEWTEADEEETGMTAEQYEKERAEYLKQL